MPTGASPLVRSESPPTPARQTEPVGMVVTFEGGPRDGERSTVVSGEPVAVLVVDESGGRYVLDGAVYRWELGR